MELQQPATPALVRNQLNPSPRWLKIEIVETGRNDRDLMALDEGERAALTLGLGLNADLIPIDERKAAALAKRKGLEVTGP